MSPNGQAILAAHVADEVEVEAGFAAVAATENLLPLIAVEIREGGIAFKGLMQLGQLQTISVFDGLRV